MATKRWTDYPRDMLRKVEMGKALEALPKPKRRKRATSPYRKASPRAATARQIDFLAAVAALTRELERAPNAVEVGARLGISRQGALQQLAAIEAKGLLVDVPKVVSSGQWALTPDGSAKLLAEDLAEASRLETGDW